ncbi:MAG: hypothetical protein NTZ25_02360 [Candidatus Peregrinibacteria bacterium]|nr:hypothetical protein [Candidatus Peregrinibacteria bacterium]
MEEKDLKKFMEYGQGRVGAKPNQGENAQILGKSGALISNFYKPLAELPDEELYKRCRECGMNARVWSRKFAALLPEVAKRGLHRRKGFTSLGEFAAKMAGMSEYAVDRILQLHAKIKDKPLLLKLFESGEEGWAKIDRVTYVATIETDKFWADKLKLLSKSALETYVQNYRLTFAPGRKQESKNLFGQAADTGLAAEGDGFQFEPPVRFSFPASRDLEFDLRVAKQKMEKETKQNLTWNETFQMIIKKTDFAPPPLGVCIKCKKKNAKVKICEKCSMGLKMGDPTASGESTGGSHG